MEAAKRPEWLAPAFVLTVSWAGVTVAVAVVASRVTLPTAIVRIAPFVLAGLIAGRLSYVKSRRARITATALLAATASVGWTAFTFATSDLSIAKAVALLGLSVPTMLVASLWAYFGMFLVNRGRFGPSTDDAQQDPELDDLERELRDEIQREQA